MNQSGSTWKKLLVTVIGLIGFGLSSMAASNEGLLSKGEINLVEHSVSSHLKSGDFLARNEPNIRNIQNFMEKCSIPSGVHFSVGTFRSFTTFGYSKCSEYLLAADIDAVAVDFNRMLIKLFTLARDFDAFSKLYLTLKSSSCEEEGFFRNTTHYQTEVCYRIIMETLEEQGYQNIRQIFSLDDYRNLSYVDYGNTEALAFHRGMYLELSMYKDLWTPEVYTKVHLAALEHRIQAVLFDIGSTKSWQVLSDILKRHARHFSIVDLSNAWWSQYSGEKSVYNIALHLSSQNTPSMHLILTDIDHDRSGGMSFVDTSLGFPNWDYLILPIQSGNKSKILERLKTFPNFLSRFGSPESFDIYMHGQEDRDPTSSVGADRFVRTVIESGKKLGRHLYIWEGER